jgi:hypothetical protein
MSNTIIEKRTTTTMPLDGHSYLVSQGWSGHGTGLRQDSIIRPLAIPQKRTLAGLGKDRDEAFPFWDQFSSPSSSINPATERDFFFGLLAL